MRIYPIIFWILKNSFFCKKKSIFSLSFLNSIWRLKNTHLFIKFTFPPLYFEFALKQPPEFISIFFHKKLTSFPNRNFFAFLTQVRICFTLLPPRGGGGGGKN